MAALTVYSFVAMINTLRKTNIEELKQSHRLLPVELSSFLLITPKFSVVPSILGFLLTKCASISISGLFWSLQEPRFHCYQQPHKSAVFTAMEACHSQIVSCPFYINFNLVTWCQALAAAYDHFILSIPIVVYHWDFDKYISLKDQKQNKHH